MYHECMPVPAEGMSAAVQRGLPHLLQHDLTTVGVDRLSDAIDANEKFKAHYKIINTEGVGRRLVGFDVVEFTSSDVQFTIWEFDEQFNCMSKLNTTLPGIKPTYMCLVI